MTSQRYLELQAKLTETTVEHAQLDAEISLLQEKHPMAELTIKRLKRRKLKLKEEILKLKSILASDIIA